MLIYNLFVFILGAFIPFGCHHDQYNKHMSQVQVTPIIYGGVVIGAWGCYYESPRITKNRNMEMYKNRHFDVTSR